MRIDRKALPSLELFHCNMNIWISCYVWRKIEDDFFLLIERMHSNEYGTLIYTYIHTMLTSLNKIHDIESRRKEERKKKSL